MNPKPQKKIMYLSNVPTDIIILKNKFSDEPIDNCPKYNTSTSMNDKLNEIILKFNNINSRTGAHSAPL